MSKAIKPFTFPFWKRVLLNFFEKDGIDAVTVLAYTSLVGFVPFLTVIISVMSVTEAFQEKKLEVLNQILDYILPSASFKVESYIIDFTQQAADLQGISIAFMFVTTLTLLWSIDTKINQMWDREVSRPFLQSLIRYLSVTLLGPLLLLGGFVSSTFSVAGPVLEIDFIKTFLATTLSMVASFIGFILIYRFIPIVRIYWKAAIWGAVFAAVEFELLKWGFSLYVKWFPTYNLVYGTFAAIPLFLFWLYLLWMVVIFNASMVFQLMKVYQSKREWIHESQEEMERESGHKDKQGKNP